MKYFLIIFFLITFSTPSWSCQTVPELMKKEDMQAIPKGYIGFKIKINTAGFLQSKDTFFKPSQSFPHDDYFVNAQILEKFGAAKEKQTYAYFKFGPCSLTPKIGSELYVIGRPIGENEFYDVVNRMPPLQQ